MTTVLLPRTRLMRVVASSAASPMAMAEVWTASRFWENRSASTAPNEAPVATPNVSGVASGLLNRDWKEAPATESPAPTKRDSRIRGSLTLQMTEWAVEAALWPFSAESRISRVSPTPT